ncbi:LysR family transcriptional regulator [Nonomuraea sp. NPDC049158]|uniref:LysR family transcriptional regulator n=1 Tax=Nonomuraea sp. NPDC049158 TaxID=3155649 RepID=UPI00340208FC
METRELAYFAAVAEELHFGRAAARLGIAQPPLSRAIQKLERRLGVTLFDRSGRRVALTPAGEVLAREAAKALDAVAAAEHRTRRAGRTEPRLVVALKPGGDGALLPDILAAYQSCPDALPVEVVLCGVAERAQLLRDGTADVAFLHHPWEDMTGFDTEPLLVEGGVAVVPARHPLAARPFVHLADLDADPTPRWPDPRTPNPGASRRHASEPHASGPHGSGPHGSGPQAASTSRGGSESHVAAGLRAGDAAQIMQLVALGRLIAVVPESAKEQVRRDLVCVPVVDAAPTTVVLAWPEQTRSSALAAFVRTAADIATASIAGAGAAVAGTDIAGTDVPGSGATGADVVTAAVADAGVAGAVVMDADVATAAVAAEVVAVGDVARRTVVEPGDRVIDHGLSPVSGDRPWACVTRGMPSGGSAR